MGYRDYAFGVVTTSAGYRDVEPLTENLELVRKVIGKESWLHLLGVTDVNYLVKWKGLYDSFDSALCTITAKNALLLNEDGSTQKLTKNHPLYPTKAEEYLRLQKINFTNYVKRRYKTLYGITNMEKLKKLNNYVKTGQILKRVVVLICYFKRGEMFG